MTQKNILIIEDEKALVELLKSELEHEGYDVHVAYDGEEGLEQIQNIEPDVVICDRSMPFMTGEELLTRMRGAYPQYNAMPFIFLTAYTNSEHKEQVKGLNAVAYLEKPVNFDVLFSTVKSALASSGTSSK